MLRDMCYYAMLLFISPSSECRSTALYVAAGGVALPFMLSLRGHFVTLSVGIPIGYNNYFRRE